MTNGLKKGENIAAKWVSMEELKHARQLLYDLSNSIDVTRPATIIMRHSLRSEIKSAEEISSTGLTYLGHTMARYFGQCLPPGHHVRLYYSINPRCTETAREIVEGYTSILKNKDSRGQVELVGPKSYLQTSTPNRSKMYNLITNLARAHSNEILGGAEFVQNWVAGYYPPSTIGLLREYVERICTHELSDLRKLKHRPNTLLINISHDLPMMGIRAWLIDDIECTDWISFLGGFILQDYDDRFLLIDRGRKFTLQKWWKKNRVTD